MSVYLKAWVAFVAAVILAAIQAYQSLDAGWSLTAVCVVALAVANVIAVYATENNGDLGLSAHAKAVMASVIAVLIIATQAAQPLVGDGSLSGEDLLTVLVAVLGAAGVWGAKNVQSIAGPQAAYDDAAAAA